MSETADYKIKNMKSKKVCVLGAGNAGLMAALILKIEKPGLDVFVVGSSEIGIVGVGESSTEHVNYFRNLLGISVKDFVVECGCTYKYGVDFQGWTDKRYIHSLISNGDGINSGPYHTEPEELFMYTNMSADCEPTDLSPPHHLKYEVQSEDAFPNQFHFDTQKLNKFLIKRLKTQNIKFHDDTITDVLVSEWGDVEAIESATTRYEADIFVDASGFKRLIANSVPGFNFKSRQKDMFVDSAFAFQCPHDEPDNYPTFTQAIKMDAGWMWRIPTSKRMGNGYAYSSKHISYDQAVQEVHRKLGFKPKIGKTFKFEAGNYDRTWVGNTVLIGLSSHFYEPLEATAIGVGISQARILANYINSSFASKETYNVIIQDLFEQVFAFVRLHYVNCKVDTPFWQEVNNTLLPVEVKKYLDITRERVLLLEDVGNRSGAVVTENRIFGAHNWNQVLYALGFLSKEVLEDHVKAYGHTPRLRPHTEDFETIPHKQLIDKWNNINENSTSN